MVRNYFGFGVNAMNQTELMNLLPHRENMLLLEDAENIDGVAVGHYNVRGDEFFLKGHFPGNPIVPGVILCEILAQTACVLLSDKIPDGKIPVYTSLNQAKFRSPVRPGDRIETRCTLKRVKHPFYFAEGTVSVDGKLCASAEFSFALTEG